MKNMYAIRTDFSAAITKARDSHNLSNKETFQVIGSIIPCFTMLTSKIRDSRTKESKAYNKAINDFTMAMNALLPYMQGGKDNE